MTITVDGKMVNSKMRNAQEPQLLPAAFDTSPGRESLPHGWEEKIDLPVDSTPSADDIQRFKAFPLGGERSCGQFAVLEAAIRPYRDATWVPAVQTYHLPGRSSDGHLCLFFDA